MAFNIIVVLVLFGALFSVGVLGADEKPKLANPWREWKNINFKDDYLEGPPQIQQFIYDLAPEYKNAEVVTFDHTVASQDYEGCVTWDYYIRQQSFGKFGLSLGIFDPETNKFGPVLWTRYGYKGDIFRTATLKFNIKKGQFLQFRASSNSDGVISFSPLRYDVSHVKCSMYDHNNDFESDLNRWEGESMKTEMFFANVPDHSSGSNQGKVGIVRYNTRITPKKMVKKAAKCLSFWYMQMSNGTNYTPLDFLVLFSGGVLWKSKSRPAQLKKWVKVEIPLMSRFTENYIAIESDKMDKDPGTFVAIDDISFSEKDCSPDPISCDFEASNQSDFSEATCGWTDGYFDTTGLKWYIGTGRPMGKGYAFDNLPVPIHQKPALYNDFTKYVPQGVPVELQSPLFPDSEEYCAEINYMYNRFQKSESFSLNQIIESDTFEDRQTLWQLEASKQNGRSMSEYVEETVRVHISRSTFQRKIALSAMSSFPTYRIGVKNINLTKGRCHTAVAPTPTTASFEKSRLPKDTLEIAHSLMQNTLMNVQQILKQITDLADPVKAVCDKIVKELTVAIAQIEFNLKK